MPRPILPKPLLIATFAAIIAGNLFAVYTIVLLRSSSVQTLRRSSRVAKINEIEGLVTEAETGQRGYLLTQRAEYLQPYQNAADKILPSIDRLQSEYVTDPQQRIRVAEVKRLALIKLEELRMTTDLAKAEETERAWEIVVSGQGKAAMDALRTALQQVRDAEWRAVADTQRRSDRILAWFYTTVFVFSLLSLLTVSAALIQVRRRSSANARLELMNEIAHELNNPLQVITNVLEILRREEIDDDMKRQLLETLNAQHGRTVEISRSILVATTAPTARAERVRGI